MTTLKDTDTLRAASIYDVADRAGVSAVTVSRVYSKKASVAKATRQRVLDAAKDLGYRRNPLAAALRGASSRSVGVLWSGGTSSMMGDLSRMLLRGLEKHDYVALALDHFHEWRRTIALLEEMRARATDAVVIQAEANLLNNKRVAALLRGVPCVVVAATSFETEHDLIVHDRLGAYRHMTDHLVDVGRTKPAVAVMARSNKTKLDAIGRQMAERGLDPETLCVLDTQGCESPSSTDQVWQALSRFDGKRFDYDALVCTSDAAAVAAYRWLTARGLRVPDDVSLVGSNNVEFAAYHSPPLATIDRRHEELATTIEDVLFTRLRNPEARPLRERVEMRFIPRESAG